MLESKGTILNNKLKANLLKQMIYVVGGVKNTPIDPLQKMNLVKSQ